MNYEDTFGGKYNLEKWQALLSNVFPPDKELGMRAFERSTVPVSSPLAEEAFRIGEIALTPKDPNATTNDLIGVYEVKLKNNVDIVRNRRGIRDILNLGNNKKGYNGAFIVSYPIDNPSVWRFSFVSKIQELDENCESREISTDAKRFTYLLGEEQVCRTAAERFRGLRKLYDKKNKQTIYDVFEAFSVEALTKEFYRDLFNWYLWATKTVKFPTNSKEDTTETKVIRMITRIMFVWFIRQKKFVPENLFNSEYISSVLKDFDPKSEGSGNYYNAILQNLFFATLNCDVDERRFAPESDTKMDIKTLYRYQEMFSIPPDEKPDEALKKLFPKIPFLNGGLFECLDKTKTLNLNGERKAFYYDGFSRNPNIRAFVPNILFFNQPPQEAETPKKKAKTPKKKKGDDLPKEGLISILRRYNFTIEENSHDDMQVALDPELLGKVFENLLAAYNPETASTVRKQTGSFYTPREIVSYMADRSLISFLGDTPEVRKLFSDSDLDDNDRSSLQPIAKKLEQIKILDPACGSGAFPVCLLNRITELLQRINPQKNPYDLKLSIIKNCLYGVDIQCIATQITKLRFFISLICDQGDMDTGKVNFGVSQLPNLETKFVAANSLIKIQKQGSEDDFFGGEIDRLRKELKRIRGDHFIARSRGEKIKLRTEDENVRKALEEELKKGVFSAEDAKQLAGWNPYDQNGVADFFDPEWMFGVSGGFDIVIGNPPYISTKGISKKDKIAYEREFGFSDDTYNLFTVKGLLLCKEDGILSFITPKTFWTTQTKRNMRKRLLEKTVNYIFDTATPFEAAVVDTCVFQVRNAPCGEDHKINFLDGTESLISPKPLKPVEQSIYFNALNQVIFKPTELNLKIYKLYNDKVKELYNTWWEKIDESTKVSENRIELEAHRAELRLKPGALALMGCLIDGGQGLATADNGRFIALRDWSNKAEIAKRERPKKLAKAIENYEINLPKDLPGLTKSSSLKEIKEYLSSFSEQGIADIFDKLKEKHGRDIFDQGFLFKIIDDDKIADPDSLTEDEKENGIDPAKKNYYVIYDKGDRDGNKWFLETPYAIAWNKENVKFLKHPNIKGKGKPVVRNPQFYFKEGICWNVTSGDDLLCRKKKNGVYDVNSMFAMSATEWLPDEFFLCVLNSRLVGNYLRAFVNNTVAVQINDVRQIPIVIPTDEQVAKAKELAERGIYLKKHNGSDEALKSLQAEVDDFVAKLYNLA